MVNVQDIKSKDEVTWANLSAMCSFYENNILFTLIIK
jgi:hypothetical protein